MVKYRVCYFCKEENRIYFIKNDKLSCFFQNSIAYIQKIGYNYGEKGDNRTVIHMRKSFIAAERSFILLISVSNILFVLVCVIASLFLHSGYGIIFSEQVKRMSAPSAGDGETAAGVLHVKITGQSVVIFGDDDNGNSDYITVKKGSEYRYISEKTDPLGNTWYKFQYSSNKTGWVSEDSATIIMMPPKGKDSVKKYVAEVGKKYGAVGVQVAVIHHGVVGETYEYGYATKGSVSDYWNSSTYKPITLRQLLTHTSSLRDNKFTGTRYTTLDQLKQKSSYRRSNDWLYNNFAIGVAGTTLELAANRTVNSYAKEKFFDPMGMDASFNSGEIKDKSLISTLYNPDDSVARAASVSANFKKREIGRSSAFFAGGLTISAKDLARLTAILANDGSYEGVRYLSEESVKLMETPCLTAVSRGHEFEQCMPLRYQTDIYGQSRLYYHLGIAYGTLSLISYNPDTRDGVVIITTGANESHDDRGIFNICGKIADYIYNS